MSDESRSEQENDTIFLVGLLRATADTQPLVSLLRGADGGPERARDALSLLAAARSRAARPGCARRVDRRQLLRPGRGRADPSRGAPLGLITSTGGTVRRVAPGFEQRVRDSFARQGFMRTLGAELVEVGEGTTAIRLPRSEPLSQQHGYVHAGALIAVVDTACGYAALTVAPPDSEVLTSELKINLLSPAAGAAVSHGAASSARAAGSRSARGTCTTPTTRPSTWRRCSRPWSSSPPADCGCHRCEEGSRRATLPPMSDSPFADLRGLPYYDEPPST